MRGTTLSLSNINRPGLLCPQPAPLKPIRKQGVRFKLLVRQRLQEFRFPLINLPIGRTSIRIIRLPEVVEKSLFFRQNNQTIKTLSDRQSCPIVTEFQLKIDDLRTF